MKRRSVGSVLVFLSVVIVVILVVPFSAIPAHDPTAPEESALPVLGEVRITVVPAALADQEPVTTTENISALVFDGLDEYFQNQSQGKVWLTGSVLDWISVPHDASFYDRGRLRYDESGNVSEGVRLFREHSLDQVFWTDANYTGHVVLMYSGRHSMNPHHSSMSVLVDGLLRSCEVSVVPEIGGFSTLAHEVSHGFGLHDLYSKNDQRLAGFMGSWALMDKTGDSFSAYDMCGYSRLSLGWIDDNEVCDVADDTVLDLVGLNKMTAGIRILRISLDQSRYYLVESRRNRGDNSGVLITLVDRTRGVNGQGRVELVRSFSGLGLYDMNLAAFKNGEMHYDPAYQITIEVVSKTETGYEVAVTFGSKEPSQPSNEDLGIGELTDCSFLTLSNGTNLIAFCGLDTATNVRSVHVYRIDDNNFIHLTSSPPANDSFNPLFAVSESGDVMLVYEVVENEMHRIVCQIDDDSFVISGLDDAHNPTALTTYNSFYVAYENRTLDDTEIIILSASSRGWHPSMSFGVDYWFMVEPNINGSPSSPQLIKANNDVFIGYIRSGFGVSVFELKSRSSIEETPQLSIREDGVEDFEMARLGEFDLFISVCLDSSQGANTSLYYYKPYSGELEYISIFLGEHLTSIAMMGVWQAYMQGYVLTLNRVWNCYREKGVTYSIPLDDQRPMGVGLLNFAGTPCLVVFASEGNAVNASFLYISSLSISSSDNITAPWVYYAVGLSVAVALALSIHWELDRVILRNLKRMVHKISRQ